MGTRSKVVENSHRPSNPTLDGKTRTLNDDDDDDDDVEGGEAIPYRRIRDRRLEVGF